MYIDNDTDLEDYYINFYRYVMECIDEDDLPPDYEICVCEDLCKTCVWQKMFDECPCFMSINRFGHDDKGKHIVVSCDDYEEC